MNQKFMNSMIAVILLILPSYGYTQVQLKGVVRNAAEPIFWANVVLKNQEGKVVAGTLSKEDGSFEMQVTAGSYKLKLSFVGSKDWEKDILLDKNTDLGTIVLHENTNNLLGVTIAAKRKLIEYKADRLVFDIENNISASGGDAITAIGAAPGVIVQNNTINLLGKGASKVMIDGRIVELSGAELIGFLKSIPVNDIKNIEVITNPPASYEAAGDGGLININLKKAVRNSWKNTTVLTYDQNKYQALTLRDNFSYSKNKVKLSMSLGGKAGNTHVKQDLDTYYPNGPWELRYDGKQKEDNVSGRLALDYDLSPGTVVGFQYLGDYSRPGSTDHMNTKIRNTNNQIDSLLRNDGLRKLSTRNNTYNIHLITQLDTSGRKLSFDVDYFKYNSKIDNSFLAETFSPEMEFLNTNTAARNVSDRKIDNKSMKVDMEHPTRFINLSYGGKASFINSKGGIQYYNTITGNPVLDFSKSNEFEYKENNQAIYLNGSKNLSHKLSLQLGLRLENTQTEGYSKTLDQTNKNTYSKLFPTFYMSYKGNENHNFLFNYGRRINRPDFGILNPFRSYISSTSYSEGNPFLKPSFSDNFDFTYVYRSKFRTNIFFNRVTDGFGPVFSSNPETNILIVTRQNYYREHYYGIGENYITDIFPWWQSQNSVYLLNSTSKFINELNATPENTVQVYLSTNNTFSLGQSTKLQVDYRYGSSYKRGLYQFGAIYGLNIGVRQSIMKDKMQLSFLANDIFNTAYLKDYTSRVNGIKQVYNENNSSRFFRLSLSYNFGNANIKVSQRDFGNDDERKRSN